LDSSVRERLTQGLASASRAEKAIATYMLARLSTVPFETAASLAAKVEVSEPTVGRFCRSLGYASFKDLKNHLKQDLGEKPWLISDRLAEFQSRAADANSHLQRSLALEIEAVVAVYELAHTAEWARVVRRLASVSAVYVTGFQAERGMAAILVHQLQYLRDGVRLLDLTAGCFTELLASNTRESALIVFAARPYSRMTRLLAQDARDAGIPVTLITDPFCDWGHELADEMLVVPTEFSHFWESTAQMASLANLLVNDVLIERGPRVEQRMDELTRLYSRYTGFVGDAEGPVTGIGKS